MVPIKIRLNGKTNFRLKDTIVPTNWETITL